MSHSARYSAVAIALHWLIAAGILGMIALGWNMDGNEDLYQLHKSIGITILILTVARIVWRVMNPPPPLPSEMTGWEKTLSHGVHVAFYALMILMPLSGWLYVSTAYDFDIPTVLFGAISWPDIPGVGFLSNAAGHGVVEFVHSKLAWVAIVLVGLHVAGAVKHELSAEEGVLKRMIPGLFGKTDQPAGAPPAAFLAAFGGAAALFLVIAALPMLGGGSNSASANGASASGEIEANWAVDQSASSISFSGTHDGSAFTGSFGDWTADIRFDPEDLAGSQVSVTVSTASATASKKLYTDSLKSAEWFNVSAYPQATVSLSNFQEAGDGSYTADATLTIKENSVTVPFTFDLTIEDGVADMTGTAEVMRTPLDLGQKSDPSADWVAEAVGIDVVVKASRAD